MSLSDIQLHFVDSFDVARRFYEWAVNKPTLAVDTETTGYLPDKDHVRLIQFGDTQQGWAIPVEGLHNWAGLVTELLNNHRGTWVGHNLKFDRAMVRNFFGYDIPLERAHDTMIMHHILNPHKRSALKTVAVNMIDPLADAGDQLLKEDFKKYGWGWDTVPVDWPNYAAYSALDTVLTARIKEQLYPEIMATAPKAYDLELATSWLVETVERRGACVNRAYAATNLEQFKNQMTALSDKIHAQYGARPGSTAAIVDALMKEGFNFDKKTAAGAVALDKAVLGNIDHPLARDVLRYRQLQKLGSTYLKNFIERTTDEHPFLHPSINSLGFSEASTTGFGVKTSRMSMSEPNLQNLPRAGSSAVGDVIRSCIIPRPGHTLLFCDLSQIESRLVAHFSRDERLMRAFDEGDFFVNMLRTAFHDDSIDRKDPRRSPMKNTFYGKIYGAQPAKLAETMGVGLDVATEFFNLINKTYPGIDRYSRRLEELAKANFKKDGLTYVRSDTTNRRYIVDQGKEYVLLNRMVQGTAAELFKTLILRLEAAGLAEYMILFVHDEVILDVPNDIVHDVAHALRDNMNCTDLITVPVMADVSYGDSWGSKKDYVFD